MNFSFATFAAVLCLLGAARCAPTPQTDACADVNTSSWELNRIAKRISEEVRNGSLDDIPFEGLAWMEATDMCDPESLKQKSAPCLGKMLSVLTHYISIVGSLSGSSFCSKYVSQVEQEMGKLHRDISKCVTSRAGVNLEQASPTPEVSGRWEKQELCVYTFDRLFSFSILAARVFALGDPAHHSDGSVQKCGA